MSHWPQPFLAFRAANTGGPLEPSNLQVLRSSFTQTTPTKTVRNDASYAPAHPSNSPQVLQQAMHMHPNAFEHQPTTQAAASLHPAAISQAPAHQPSLMDPHLLSTFSAPGQAYPPGQPDSQPLITSLSCPEPHTTANPQFPSHQPHHHLQAAAPLPPDPVRQHPGPHPTQHNPTQSNLAANTRPGMNTGQTPFHTYPPGHSPAQLEANQVPRHTSHAPPASNGPLFPGNGMQQAWPGGPNTDSLSAPVNSTISFQGPPLYSIASFPQAPGNAPLPQMSLHQRAIDNTPAVAAAAPAYMQQGLPSWGPLAGPRTSVQAHSLPAGRPGEPHGAATAIDKAQLRTGGRSDPVPPAAAPAFAQDTAGAAESPARVAGRVRSGEQGWGPDGGPRPEARRDGFMGRVRELQARPSDEQRERAERAKLEMKRGLEAQVRRCIVISSIDRNANAWRWRLVSMPVYEIWGWWKASSVFLRTCCSRPWRRCGLVC